MELYNILNLIINIFIALGTCGAVFVSLGFFKEKEKLEGTYWVYKNFIRVHLTNKSSRNCILEKGSYLWLTMGKDTVELQTMPLENTQIIPSKFSCGIHYAISENTYQSSLYSPEQNVYLYTKQGTLVKLKKGVSSLVSEIKLVEENETKI